MISWLTMMYSLMRYLPEGGFTGVLSLGSRGWMSSHRYSPADHRIIMQAKHYNRAHDHMHPACTICWPQLHAGARSAFVADYA